MTLFSIQLTHNPAAPQLNLPRINSSLTHLNVQGARYIQDTRLKNTHTKQKLATRSNNIFANNL